MRTIRFLSALLLLVAAACSNNAPGHDTSTGCGSNGVTCHDGQDRGGQGMGRGGMGGGGMGGGGMGM
jgi:hypothetical protein